MSEKRLWILPVNDGEMVEIRKLLVARGEQILESGQRWGASWERLEPAVVEGMERFHRLEPVGRIYGVELAGAAPPGAVCIDHHRYQDEDRWNPKSSLEQVAAVVGTTLDRWQELVAANDRGYIPAMRAMGASADEIAAVRQQDRAAQGITEEHDRQAELDIARAVWAGELVHVVCPNGITSAHSDRLFDRAREVLLTSPTKWSYFGPRHLALAEKRFAEKTWAGGAPESGYWGIEGPSLASRAAIAALLGVGLDQVGPDKPSWEADDGEEGKEDRPIGPGRTEPL